MSRVLDILNLQRKRKDVSARGRVLPTASRTCLMGVLNITPDSFTGGAEYMDADAALKRANWLERSGADIIDIGGESSRPGASPVSAEEELRRIIPVIDKVVREVSVPISVDTYKSEVAKIVLEKGVSIINDITALNGDPAMAEVVAEYGAGIVLMHMKGKPATMQSDTHYGDFINEILSYLSDAVRKAEKSGISPDAIIVDPGIGFGKTAEQNLVILKDLGKFRSLGKPVLVGTSRKAFIGALTGKEVQERIFGTASSVAAAILNGADIVRVHDIAEMRDVVLVADAVKGA